MTASSVSYRERVLWEIAERYDEFTDPLSFAGLPGDGDTAGLLRMPRSYTPSVVEFERLLHECRELERPLWWHLVEWWIKPSRVVKFEPVFVKRHGRRVELKHADGSPVRQPVVRVLRNPLADEGRARAAVAWMAERWGLATEPMLPEFEKFDAAAAA